MIRFTLFLKCDYTRNSVKECYDRIIADLEASLILLEGLSPTTVYRAGPMAAHLLLSRVQLHTGDWNEVIKHCDAVIGDKKFYLIDFNNFEPLVYSDAVSTDSPETIFSNGKNHWPFFKLNEASGDNLRFYFRGSDEILSLYAETDLRRDQFFRKNNNWFPQKNNSEDGYNGSDFFMLRLPEAYLNKAEALACIGIDTEAADLVLALQEKRHASGTVKEIDQTGEGLIKVIRDERRRELSFEGQRWFDLRRNAVHPKWPEQKEIRHPYYVLTEVTGDIVLGKYDEDEAYYVLPIPDFEVSLSGGAMKQNDRRILKTAQ